MAETYLEITQQIEKLKQKAETVRSREIAGVIERIRTAIQAYGLTSAQLFGAPGSAKGAGAPSAKRAGAAGKSASQPRFRDAEGHSWSGRGPRPGWIKAALAAGKSLGEFEVAPGAGDDAAPAPSRKRRARRAAVKAPTVIKYRDDAGHAWTGRGPRPGWVKAALETGKTLADLSVAPSEPAPADAP